MSPIGSLHAHSVVQLTRLLGAGVGNRAWLSIQNPLRLGDLSEPVPDVALLRPHATGYAEAHPGPTDVMLVIEVADTTVGHDRGRKLPLYARFGVPEVWIVVLRRSIVEVYRNPGAGGYGSKTILARGESLSPLAFPDVTVPVDDILG
jgi:Uma2 family endonuclease